METISEFRLYVMKLSANVVAAEVDRTTDPKMSLRSSSRSDTLLSWSFLGDHTVGPIFWRGRTLSFT